MIVLAFLSVMWIFLQLAILFGSFVFEYFIFIAIFSFYFFGRCGQFRKRAKCMYSVGLCDFSDVGLER